MDKNQLRNALEKAPGNADLLFSDGSGKEYWRRIGSSREYAEWVDEIRSEGNRLLNEPIPELTYTLFAGFEKSGVRLDFERVYFARRRRLNTMALLSLLEPDNVVYREALEDILWSVCNEYTWCLPAHLKGSAETDGKLHFDVDSPEWSRGERGTRIDLFSAETGFALSEILHLTEDWLPQLIKSRIVEEIVQRLFKPYLRQGPHHWENARHNWSAVCAGSIGSAALYLVQDSDRLAEIISKVLSSMDCFLAGFGEDGACLEGIGYWNYGFGFFVYFADLLKKRTRGSVDLLQNFKVRSIAGFQQKAYLDGDLTVNFSDSERRSQVHIGLTHYLADLFSEVAAPPMRLRSAYTDDHCSRWAPALRDLLWFDPSRKGESWEAADFYLSDAQWMISRHVTGKGRYGFAAKGGHNKEPHNHNDLGQFILTGNGQVFLCDLGAGEYTAGYFGKDRYTYDCNGSQGHSVPIVDGLYQVEGADHAAKMLQAELSDEADGFQVDIAGAYRHPHLTSLTRGFVWQKQEVPKLTLTDEFVFSHSPERIVERFVTMIEPSLEGDAVVLQGDGGCGGLAIHYDANAVQPAVESRSYRDHSGSPAVWFAVDFLIVRPDKEQTVEFTFEFIDSGKVSR